MNLISIGIKEISTFIHIKPVLLQDSAKVIDLDVVVIPRRLWTGSWIYFVADTLCFCCLVKHVVDIRPAILMGWIAYWDLKLAFAYT